MVLIGVGVLFLLDTLDLVKFNWIIRTFWPLVLIGIGVRVLLKNRKRSG